MQRRVGLAVMGTFLLTAGCAAMGMNSVEKLQQLSPGMSSDEVVEVLGEPKSSQMTEDKWILSYTLHENWKGFVPYFVVFDKDSRRLEAWYEDEEGYQRSQAQMGETFAPVLEAGNEAAGNQAGGGAAPAAPAGPNDPVLQLWITGNYYYFSSSQVVSASSERSFVLCADGRYRMTGEFSASGTNAGWGAASQGGSSGRWIISGDRQSGTITLTGGGGTTASIRYQVASKEEQTMYFDQVMFAYAGVADCG